MPSSISSLDFTTAAKSQLQANICSVVAKLNERGIFDAACPRFPPGFLPLFTTHWPECPDAGCFKFKYSVSAVKTKLNFKGACGKLNQNTVDFALSFFNNASAEASKTCGSGSCFKIINYRNFSQWVFPISYSWKTGPNSRCSIDGLVSGRLTTEKSIGFCCKGNGNPIPVLPQPRRNDAPPESPPLKKFPSLPGFSPP